MRICNYCNERKASWYVKETDCFICDRCLGAATMSGPLTSGVVLGAIALFLVLCLVAI